MEITSANWSPDKPRGISPINRVIADKRHGYVKSCGSALEAAREVAAYQLSLLVDPGLVPETIRVDFPQVGDNAVLSYEVIGETNVPTRDFPVLQQFRMAMFDLLVNNEDRNWNNRLLTPARKAVAIDHAFAFYAGGRHGPNYMHCDFAYYIKDKVIPKRLRESYADVSMWRLENALESAGLPEVEISWTRARFRSIKEMRYMRRCL